MRLPPFNERLPTDSPVDALVLDSRRCIRATVTLRAGRESALPATGVHRRVHRGFESPSPPRTDKEPPARAETFGRPAAGDQEEPAVSVVPSRSVLSFLTSARLCRRAIPPKIGPITRSQPTGLTRASRVNFVAAPKPSQMYPPHPRIGPESSVLGRDGGFDNARAPQRIV